PLPGTSFPRLIGGQSIDITDERNAEGIIQKTNERFYYVTKATSDSIWDLNIRTGQIFRSESFFRLTGYEPADIESNLDWWFSKTHPDDRERIMLEFKQCLAAGRQQWHAEYRFQCANGQYKYFSDKGFIIYEEGKPVRSIGAIQDLTEIKMLERKLREQEIRKRKQISLAVIAAQDKERNEIGKELHDNINQMLSTVRLLLSSIRSQEMEQNQVFSQCKEYLDLAIEEIRRQSKSLSSSFVREVGLKAAIQDIAKNIALSKLMQIDIDYDDSLETTLSPEQRLMACRVVQEQTNNIIRHAKASHIRIAAREQEGHLELLICDDGIGFDTKQTAHGVGLTNIRNRVEAFNGRLK
ncbi:MAG: PAS domain-containing protein, partial [Chitinophaga rupis]